MSELENVNLNDWKQTMEEIENLPKLLSEITEKLKNEPDEEKQKKMAEDIASALIEIDNSAKEFLNENRDFVDQVLRTKEKERD